MHKAAGIVIRGTCANFTKHQEVPYVYDVSFVSFNKCPFSFHFC